MTKKTYNVRKCYNPPPSYFKIPKFSSPLPSPFQDQQMSSFSNGQELQMKSKVEKGQFVVKMEVIVNFYV